MRCELVSNTSASWRRARASARARLTIFSADPDSVPLLERGGERLAVGDGHSAVEHHLPLFLRARDEPLVTIGALVHVDVPVGGRLGEGGGCKAGERDREAKQTFHERTKCNRGARSTNCRYYGVHYR